MGFLFLQSRGSFWNFWGRGGQQSSGEDQVRLHVYTYMHKILFCHPLHIHVHVATKVCIGKLWATG